MFCFFPVQSVTTTAWNFKLGNSSCLITVSDNNVDKEKVDAAFTSSLKFCLNVYVISILSFVMLGLN